LFASQRVLGFRRVPPTAGRKVNLFEDIKELDNLNATGRIYLNEGMLSIHKFEFKALYC